MTIDMDGRLPLEVRREPPSPPGGTAVQIQCICQISQNGNREVPSDRATPVHACMHRSVLYIYIYNILGAGTGSRKNGFISKNRFFQIKLVF